MEYFFNVLSVCLAMTVETRNQVRLPQKRTSPLIVRCQIVL